MKLYTLDYSFNQPTQQTITVGTNTDYMIGVSAIKNGQILGLHPQDVTLTIGENVLTSEKLINGYVVFDYSQGRTPASEIVKVTILGTAFDLLIIGKYSSKGDVIVAIEGTEYTAGNGISIAEGEISINEEVVAVKTDLEGVLKEGDVYTNDEIDNKINQFAAHYLTKRTGSEGSYDYPQFATHADLVTARQTHTEANPQFFYNDDPHTPDKNDYCVVLSDETHENATTRYSFVGDWPDGRFRYQYTINETALSEDQWKAINAGITSEKLEAIESAVATIPTQTHMFHVEYEDGGIGDFEVFVK